jgi:hypothetical protein
MFSKKKVGHRAFSGKFETIEICKFEIKEDSVMEFNGESCNIKDSEGNLVQSLGPDDGEARIQGLPRGLDGTGTAALPIWMRWRHFQAFQHARLTVISGTIHFRSQTSKTKTPPCRSHQTVHTRANAISLL